MDTYKDPIPDHVVEGVMKYEEGKLDDKQTIQLFQDLIDCDLADKLGDEYSTMASILVRGGLCKENTRRIYGFAA